MDYAGNRIAKIGELSTTYYLVDTNGALSQVLAEYDENSSLTTYYTRGEELISQERGNEKHYYLYDGFDSVRMLTDENGTATDFYTYDAFGNLTEQIGDTENSYLYRGEQFDSFTGLYYLRARYMNPSTGTFITMDEYAGSVFEPVSLHKYLYANANPVMYSDPSGYFSLGELSVNVSILNSMECGSILGGLLNSLLTALRGGTTEQIQQAFLEGFVSGGILGGAFGIIGTWAVTYWQARLLLSAMEFTGGYFAFSAAVQDFISASNSEDGKAVGYCAAGVIESFLGFASMFSGAKNFNASGELYRQQSDTPLSGSSSSPKTFMTGKDGEKELARLYGGESQKYFKTSLGKRYVDQFSNGVAHESKVGYTSLTKFVEKKVLKDAELIRTGQINSAHWHFFRSGVTGEIGPSQPLEDFLKQNGINYTIH